MHEMLSSLLPTFTFDIIVHIITALIIYSIQNSIYQKFICICPSKSCTNLYLDLITAMNALINAKYKT